MAQYQTALLFTALDASGDPISGAHLYFYAAGTLTDAVVYADEAGSTPLSQPVVADSAGRFPNIYVGSGDALRAILKDATDVQIRDFGTISQTASVGTNDIEDGAITAAKMADDSVPARAIEDGAVDNAKMASMGEATVKGRGVGTGTGDPQDLDGTDLAAIVDPMVGAGMADGLPGLVTKPLIANAAQFLRGDGTWATPTPTDAHLLPGAGAVFTSLGSASPTINHGLNIASISKTTTGTWLVTFTTPFANEFYRVCFAGQRASSNSFSLVDYDFNVAKLAGSFSMVCTDSSGPFDPASIEITVFPPFA